MTRARITRLSAALATGLALALVYGEEAANPVRAVFGERGIQIISNADRVKIYRLKGVLGLMRARLAATNPATLPAEEMVENVPIDSHGPDVDKDMAKRMKAVLLDEKTYQGPITSCAFDPHFALRFIRGKEAVNVLMCFHCYIIEAWVRDSDGKLVHQGDGVFDGSDGELKKLIDQVLAK